MRSSMQLLRYNNERLFYWIMQISKASTPTSFIITFPVSFDDCHHQQYLSLSVIRTISIPHQYTVPFHIRNSTCMEEIIFCKVGQNITGLLQIITSHSSLARAFGVSNLFLDHACRILQKQPKLIHSGKDYHLID